MEKSDYDVIKWSMAFSGIIYVFLGHYHNLLFAKIGSILFIFVFYVMQLWQDYGKHVTLK